jgi:4-hydroxy-tetrahydrodipicolinate synthase
MIELKDSFLRGSYPPVVTPFKNGAIDIDTFRVLLQRQVQCGSQGVVVAGTTGEPSSLSVDERCELIRVAVEVVNKKIPVVAGTGSQSLAETIEITKKAEEYGADAVLVVTPYYIKPPQRGLVRYFVSVAQQVRVPLLIYHIPGRAAVTLSPSTVAQIVEQAPNVVGIKHASTDLEFVSELLTRLGSEFRIFCGLEALSLPMMAIGAAGTMNAVGNLDPSRVAKLCDAVAANDLKSARKLHFDLLALNEAIFLDTNPIPLKYMMWRIGLLEHPEVRLPLASATSEQQEKLDGVLSAAGLLKGQPAKSNQPLPARSGD